MKSWHVLWSAISLCCAAGCATGTGKTSPAAELAGWSSPVRDGPRARMAPAGEEAEVNLLTAKFKGTSRRTAKTTLSSAPVEDEYADLDTLLETLYADEDMEEFAEESGIKKGQDSDRMEEEERNVRVRAWLYAVKRESDRDFHVILGTKPGSGAKTYMNVEVSGLPANSSPDYQTLKNVRQQLFTILNKWPGTNKYYKPASPIPVEVQGSIFWDIEHVSTKVGPAGMKPDTAWEIHPISDLQQGHN